MSNNYGRIPKNICEENNALLGEVIEHYKNHSLALLLGAGVSDKFLPQWDKLVKQMYWTYLCNIFGVDAPQVDCFPDDFAASSLVEVAQYVSPIRYDGEQEQHYIHRTQEFCSKVACYILQNEFGKTISKVRQELHWNTKRVQYSKRQLGKFKNRTLLEVGRLIFPPDSSLSGGKAMISHIITYNYDDILEWLLSHDAFNNYTKTNHQSVVTFAFDSMDPFNHIPDSVIGDGVNIYHVHGLACVALPMYRNQNEFTKRAYQAGGYENTNLVLNDTSYIQMRESDLLWGNSQQSQVISRHPTLIVGFSGSDMNFRRICSLKRDSSMPMYMLRSLKHINEDYDFLQKNGIVSNMDDSLFYISQVVSRYMKDVYNIRIIWLESSKKSADVLKGIYSSA